MAEWRNGTKDKSQSYKISPFHWNLHLLLDLFCRLIPTNKRKIYSHKLGVFKTWNGEMVLKIRAKVIKYNRSNKSCTELLPDLFCLGRSISFWSLGGEGWRCGHFLRRKNSFSALVLAHVLFTTFFTTFPVLICIRFPPNFLAQEFFFP